MIFLPFEEREREGWYRHEKILLKTTVASVDRARKLRKEMTEAEKKFWSRLRNHQMNVHFRRQVVVGPHILDFLASKANLVIELDESQHLDRKVRGYDTQRKDFLEARGLEVLRFNNVEFLKNPNAVVEKIYDEIKKKL